ncbi:hypothetical protein [Phenylobacterium sp.]|jgi:hypothetical protein|uniref:hypothetical protein n=1 Tax=Phenylobacterium sp. TaxID=1871053 RepID=UPI002F92C189
MSASDSAARRLNRITLAVGLALAGLSLLLSFYDPAMPAGDLDSSWAMASEYALKHGLVFGRDFIFTFGPYNPLATRFYDPAWFRLVLAYDVFCIVALFWTPLGRRSLAALVGLTLVVLVLRLPSDALFPVTLFAIFLIALQRQRAWPLVFVALTGPIVLAKLSFIVVLAPLMVLADLERATARRVPYLTVAMAASIVAAYVAAGQPLGAFPTFAVNALEIILGYGPAQQIPGDRAELAATLTTWSLGIAFVGVVAARRWAEDRRDLRPVAAWLGFVWLLFGLFKMGFLRQDVHTMVFHMAAPAGLALAVGYFDRPEYRSAPRTALFLLGLVGALFFSFYWRSVLLSRFSLDRAVRPAKVEGPALAHDAGRVVTRLAPRMQTGLKWATGQGFGQAADKRRKAEAALARDFPRSVTGTVDAVPWDLAPLIASGLEYRPRPVPQNYQSNTPKLQALDAAHFAGRTAPDTLILRIEDVDGRLPSLALGPSLPVIGQRYDALDRDPLGLVLRRRATPRPMQVERTRAQSLTLGAWHRIPAAPGRLIMARVSVERTLAGRAVGFLFREPVMRISLRTAAGREVTYRFVPAMAELGTAVSPLPAAWPLSAPVLLDPAAGGGEPVTAMRLTSAGGDGAFGRASVAYDLVSFAPGFAGALPP